MLVRDAAGVSELVDFRETAPRSASRDMFNYNLTLATDSTRGAGVPGEIKGFAMAHTKYGILPWASLFDPSICLAKEGFEVTEKMAEMISSAGMRDIYFRPDGKAKQKGDFITRPNLAVTLEVIAREGPDAFYTGAVAQSLVRAVESQEGGITMEDMSTYTAKFRAPLVAEFAGFKVTTAGPPTCGPILLQILKILERSHLRGNHTDATVAQRMIEAFKFGYVDRMSLGDPDFVHDIDRIVQDIISDAKADSIAPRINDEHTSPPEYYLDGKFSEVDSHGTTHITTMDRSGMVASATSTVNLEWGCRYMDSESGIIINNELDDFSIPHANNSFGLPPSRANFIAPLKRPLSSAAPAIFEKDGSVVLAVGGAGGSRIITAVAQTVLSILVFGIAPDKAVNSCRLHHQLIPNSILAEHRCDQQLLIDLSQKGHTIVVMAPKQFATTVNLIVRHPDGGMVPVVDERKGGIAGGF